MLSRCMPFEAVSLTTEARTYQSPQYADPLRLKYYFQDRRGLNPALSKILTITIHFSIVPHIPHKMPPRISLRSAQALRRNLLSSNSQNASILEIRPLQLNLPTRYQNTPHHRSLSSSSSLQFQSTPTFLKKKDKGNKNSSSESESSSSTSSSAAAEDNDPFDFSTLQAGIDKSLEKLKNDLGKLRTGGRFNPEVLEGLRVKLGKDAKESFRLGDLAQVLPKGGRSVVVLVGEKDVC